MENYTQQTMDFLKDCSISQYVHYIIIFFSDKKKHSFPCEKFSFFLNYLMTIE